VDAATVSVNLTNSMGVTFTATLWVSPIAPVVWSELSVTGGGSVDVELNTTVLRHFYHRENTYNVSFPTPTTAACNPTSSPIVTRSSEFEGSNATVIGAIHHTVRGSSATPTCSTSGDASASVRFTVSPSSSVTVSTVVRTSRDPDCVP
jgi:hypothetical protein